LKRWRIEKRNGMRKKSKGKDEQCRGLKMGKEAMRKGDLRGKHSSHRRQSVYINFYCLKNYTNWICIKLFYNYLSCKIILECQLLN
jgi:hypothetical protein